jgi:mono/diheme cytochrome c family protein
MAIVHLTGEPAGRATRPASELLSLYVRRRPRIFAALVAMSWLLSAGPANADEETTAAAPIDFLSDIQPIFVEHCYKCHGGDQRRGGLKLDVRDDAASGGDSGKPILGGTLETNELYNRVSSADRTFRMPKNAAALSDQQIDRIRRWVEQQTPWPDTNHGSRNDSEFVRWLEDWGSFADRHEGELKFAMPYGLAFIVAQLAILAVVRCGRAFQRSRPWATGNARRFCSWCNQVKPRELALAWLLMGVSLGLVVMRGHQRKLDDDIAKLQIQKLKAEDTWSRSAFGSPPIPFRLDEPKQIKGTYYRGNCERNAQLFNNGNYLTAIFRISLCDEKRQPLELGDPDPIGGVYVRMELERAPGTAEGFFSREMIGSVFLSKEFYHNSSEPLRDAPTRLDTLEEGKRWVSCFPVGPPEAPTEPRKGVIYVYTGRIDKGTARGDPQYAIVYDLHFHDGKLTDDSDLWMNSFGNPAVAPPPQFNKIPFAEWFDYRPIPAITGPNSSDSKILGLEEYVKKGLIPPQPPGASSAAAGSPDDRPPVNQEDDSVAEPRPQVR